MSAKGKLTITNVNLQYNFLDSVAVGRNQEQLQQILKKIDEITAWKDSSLHKFIAVVCR